MKSKPKRIPELTLDDIKRFMRQTKLQDNGCIVWTGERRRGYGRFLIGNKRFPAHRVSFVWSHGFVLPPSFVVMHSCDNRACVASHHLGPGTHLDNMKDRTKKQRTIRGQLSSNSVISDERASEMKTLVQKGLPLKDAAKQFGLKEATARAICRGIRYAHIQPSGNVIPPTYALVDWKLAELIKLMNEQKCSVRTIVTCTQIKLGTVQDVLKSKRRKHLPPLNDAQALRLHRMVTRYGLGRVSRKAGISRQTIIAFSHEVLRKQKEAREAQAVQASSHVPEQPLPEAGRDVQGLRSPINEPVIEADARRGGESDLPSLQIHIPEEVAI